MVGMWWRNHRIFQTRGKELEFPCKAEKLHTKIRSQQYKANTPCGTSMRDWQAATNVNVFHARCTNILLSEWNKRYIEAQGWKCNLVL